MGDSLENGLAGNMEDSGIAVTPNKNNNSCNNAQKGESTKAENISITNDHVEFDAYKRDSDMDTQTNAAHKRRHSLTPENSVDKEVFAERDKADTSMGRHEEIQVKRCCNQNIDTEDSTLEYDLSEETHTNSLGETKEAQQATTAAHSVVGSQEATTAAHSVVGSQEAKTSLNKIESVHSDAKHIATILERCDIDTIYEKVKENRKIPNRLEKVTNDLLESGNKEDHALEVDEAGTDQTANKKTEKMKESDTEERKFADVGRVLFILKGKCPGKNVNPDEVYRLIEVYLQEKNRVSVVVDALVNGIKVSDVEGATAPAPAPGTAESQGDILDSVGEFRKDFPNVDPNEIFALLEKYEAHPNRKAKVKEEIDKMYKTNESAANNTQSQMDPLTANDPLYKDMQTIARMFPEKDQHEIYALLEAHYRDPNRIEIVTDELLQMQQGSQDPDEVPMLGPNKEQGRSILVIQKEVQTLMAIFPDCDPDYLFVTLEEMESDPNRVDSLSTVMFEGKNYPKLQDRMQKQKNATLRRRLQTLEINIPEFLEMFPDPVTEFTDETKAMTENYKKHAVTQLKNAFNMMRFTYVKQIFQEHHFRYCTTFIQLEEECQPYLKNPQGKRRITGSSKKFRNVARHEIEEFPDEPDEYFYKELQYTQSKDLIKAYVEEQKQLKEERLKNAKENGELNECGCCFDDEILFEDMRPCTDGHLFCMECIRRSSEEIIGQGNIEFPCLSAGCKSTFDHTTLKSALSKKIFSNLLKKIQEEEIKRADIPDLVSCPFCPFATIITDEEDKVFKCHNPECLKESCRLCKESNHIPLKCEEVEKQGETSMRVYIEKKITEAMLRTCWKCEKRFFKTEGCNKMTCTCGAHMCYVCREPIEGYEHFSGPNACPQDTDIRELHKQEMEKAGQEAKAHFLKEHPDAADTELKNDPLKLIEEGQRIPQLPDFPFGFGRRPRLFPYVHRPFPPADNRFEFHNIRHPVPYAPQPHYDPPYAGGFPPPVPHHQQHVNIPQPPDAHRQHQYYGYLHRYEVAPPIHQGGIPQPPPVPHYLQQQQQHLDLADPQPNPNEGTAGTNMFDPVDYILNRPRLERDFGGDYTDRIGGDYEEEDSD